MPQVTVSVNGHNYNVACDEGEENHLRDLARYLDKHVQDLALSIGQVGETRLLLMGGLVLADQMSEMLARIDDLETEIERLRTTRGGGSDKAAGKSEAVAVEVLEAATRRLEDIAGRLDQLQ